MDMSQDQQRFFDMLGSVLAEQAKIACTDEGITGSEIGQEELDVLIGSFMQTFKDE